MSQAAKGAPSVSRKWEPTRRIDGTIEIWARFFHDNGRFVSSSISPEAYTDLFLSSRLGWQIERTERPDHNPTLEELADILEKHRQANEVTQSTAWSAHLDRALTEPGILRLPKKLPELSREEEKKRESATLRVALGKRAGLSRLQKIAALREASTTLKAIGFRFNRSVLVTEALKSESAIAGLIAHSSLLTFVYTELTDEEEKELGFRKERRGGAGRR